MDERRDEPPVAVIVPMYHAAKFVHQCLDTIMNQTYKNVMVYAIVDDMFYDDTLDRIMSHELYNAKRVIVFAVTDKTSPARARNTGIRLLRGEQYVAFLDVDDTWEMNKLHKQVTYMRRNASRVCFTGGWWHREFGSFRITGDVESSFKSCMFIWSSVMFHRSVLEYAKSLRGYVFDESFPQCDDGELLMFLHRNGVQFNMIRVPLTHVHEHGDNLTQGGVWKPNYWAYRAWTRNGYYITGLKHLLYGAIAVVADRLGMRTWLRKQRMVMHTRFNMGDD